MYSISPEEFFMYLIIALIILAPLAARLYRMLTAGRVKRSVLDEIRKP